MTRAQRDLVRNLHLAPRLSTRWDGSVGPRVARWRFPGERELAQEAWANVPGYYDAHERQAWVERQLRSALCDEQRLSIAHGALHLDPSGAVMLMAAIRGGEIELARQMLPEAPLRAGIIRPEAALYEAVIAGEIDLACAIFARLSPQARKSGRAPLVCADAGSVQAARVLMELGMPGPDRAGRAAYIAVCRHPGEAAASLLDIQGNTAPDGHFNLTHGEAAALLRAAVSGKSACVGTLIGRASDIERELMRDRLLLHAAEAADIDTFEALWLYFQPRAFPRHGRAGRGHILVGAGVDHACLGPQRRFQLLDASSADPEGCSDPYSWAEAYW